MDLVLWNVRKTILALASNLDVVKPSTRDMYEKKIYIHEYINPWT